MATDFKACCIEGCKGDAQRSQGGATGMCRRHYNRLRKYGDPLGGRAFNGDAIAFLKNTAIAYAESDCLKWPYALDAGGYPAIGRSKAHRVLCEMAYGAPPSSDHEAAHGCGNRSCVNPNHLRWATKSENQRDRIIHGTHNRGERCRNAKLTEAEAREILDLRGKMTAKAVSMRYPVSESAVEAIFLRHSWGWLDLAKV